MHGLMDWLWGFLQSLIDIIVSVARLVWNLLGGLVDFIKVLPSVISMLTSSIANLPDIILPFATISITAAVVLLILGRSNTS